jgi:hypothetical protein
LKIITAGGEANGNGSLLGNNLSHSFYSEIDFSKEGLFKSGLREQVDKEVKEEIKKEEGKLGLRVFK